MADPSELRRQIEDQSGFWIAKFANKSLGKAEVINNNLCPAQCCVCVYIGVGIDYMLEIFSIMLFFYAQVI